jgi:hypothetical protein
MAEKQHAKGETRFAQWLNDQGMSCHTFWEVYGGVGRKATFFLSDPTRYALPTKSIPLRVLARVAEITGISPGELVDDVVAWMPEVDE